MQNSLKGSETFLLVNPENPNPLICIGLKIILAPDVIANDQINPQYFICIKLAFNVFFN